jgi:hypothetical protein
MPSRIQGDLQKEPNDFVRDCRLVRLEGVEDDVLLERCHPRHMVGLAQTVMNAFQQAHRGMTYHSEIGGKYACDEPSPLGVE